MRCFEDLGAVRKFRRKGWGFQETFHTPLKELDGFVGSIVAAIGEVRSGRVTIERVVFEPRNLVALTSGVCGESEVEEGWSVEATGRAEVEGLLKAALGDWVDFLFVAAPAPFVVYADHDQYVTVFAMRKAGLTGVVAGLAEKGFRRVEGYRRNL